MMSLSRKMKYVLDTAWRLIEDTDLAIVIQELLRTAHQALDFERVRFYLALPEHGSIRQEGIQGGPVQEDELALPLSGQNLLGRVVLEKDGPQVLRVAALGMAEEAADGLPTCFVRMDLPGEEVGIIVADNPRTRADLEDENVNLLGLLSQLGLFPLKNSRDQEVTVRAISLVSHELRTPLTSITAFSEMLADGDAGALNEKQSRFVRRISKAAAQLEKIVEDLLELSRLQAATPLAERTQIRIRPFLADTTQNLLPQASVKNIELIVEAPDDLPYLETDERRLQQALSNFIDNAIKYSPANTKIIISAVNQDGKTRLSVTDEGPGIAPEDQRHVLEEFYRCYRGEDDLINKGSGLGLPIVTRLAEIMDARVEFESELGKGSTFSLVFDEA